MLVVIFTFFVYLPSSSRSPFWEKADVHIERRRLPAFVFGIVEPWKFNNSNRKQSKGRCPRAKAWVSDMLVIGEVSKDLTKQQASKDTPLPFCM